MLEPVKILASVLHEAVECDQQEGVIHEVVECDQQEGVIHEVVECDQQEGVIHEVVESSVKPVLTMNSLNVVKPVVVKSKRQKRVSRLSCGILCQISFVKVHYEHEYYGELY